MYKNPARVPVMFTALLGVMLSVLAYVVVVNFEHSKARSDFEKVAFEHMFTLEEHIDSNLSGLRSVVTFFDSTDHVSSRSFKTFVTPLLQDARDINTLLWLPRVSADERASFPAAAAQLGSSAGTIVERGAHGNIIPAASRALYFPVLFSESRDDNQPVAGLDYASDQHMAALLDRAGSSGEIQVSSTIQVGEQGTERVFIFVLPVFHAGPALDSSEQRWQNLRGYILANIGVKDLFVSLYSGRPYYLRRADDIDIYLYDVDATAGSDLLYTHHARLRHGSPASVLTREQALTGVHNAHEFKVGGKTLQVVARPVSNELGQGINWVAWFALLLGLMLTGLLAAYLRTSIREKYSIERLVEQRTRSLDESREQIQATVDNLLDGVITIDEAGRIESFNLAAERIFAYKAEEVIGQNIKMLMPDPYRQEHDGYLQNYLTTGHRRIIGHGREVKGMRKGGECFPLDLAVNELKLHDRRAFIGITRDISDSKHATKELDSFKYVLDNTLDMIFMFDADTLEFVYLNRGAVESMGYSSKELLQMTPYDIKPMFTEDEFRQLLVPLLHGERDVLHFETLHRRKDGIDFPVEIFLQLVRDTGGSGRFIAIVRDITERKRAEQQTKRYALALEQLHNITSQIDLTFDERMHALLELGRSFFDLPLAILSRIEEQTYTVEYAVGPEGAPLPGAKLALEETYCNEICIASHPIGYHHVGASNISEHPCYKKFGLESYIGTPLMIRGKLYGTMNFSGPQPREAPFDDGDYSLIRIFAQWVSNEITRKQIEDDLQDNAARLSSILDTVVDAIITFNQSGYIESLNTAGADLFGYGPDELVGQPFMRLLSAREAKQYKQYLDNYINTGEATILGKRVEANAIRKDGSQIPIEFAANEMKLGGMRYFTAVVRDISERRKVDRMKSEFVSTVSHELRTPLTSIRGALSLVLGKAADELPEHVRHMLDMANRNSERLTYLINDILDLEKIDAGHLEFDLQSLDLDALIKRAVEENESYAHSHNITLSYSNNVEETTIVFADENRLLQVMANLVSNAVKYANEHSTVMINLKKTDGRFRVSVRDRGVGIPEEFRSRIFARFAQADSSDSRDKGGTGLGLAITKAIVERHGGHIDYCSEVGAGTEFFFDLPQWKAIKLSPENDTNKPKVLICEDNADVADMLANLLMQDGFISDIAATLNDARNLLAAHDYQLLLLDLILPDGDGLELIHDIRGSERTASLPVIVVSARAGEAQQEFRGDALTIIDWMQKPIDRSRLSKALQHVMISHHRPRVLHVEDDLDVVQITRTLLEDVGDIDYVTSLAQARERISNKNYDLLILDLSLPDGSGLELLEELKGCCPVVIFSGVETEKKISESVAAAFTKSRTNGEELLTTVRRVLRQSSRDRKSG